jgi:hypothetical protein
LRIVFLFSAWLLSFGAMAAPGDVATLDRSTWPEQLGSPTLFDVASRAEILMFARVLLASEALDEPRWPSAWACARSTWRDQPCAPAPVAASVEHYNFAQQSCEQDASFCFLVEDMPTCASRPPSSRSARTATTSSGPNRATCFTPSTWTSCCARPRCFRSQ